MEWCEGFTRLLDLLDVDRAHILGVSEAFGCCCLLAVSCARVIPFVNCRKVDLTIPLLFFAYTGDCKIGSLMPLIVITFIY